MPVYTSINTLLQRAHIKFNYYVYFIAVLSKTAVKRFPCGYTYTQILNIQMSAVNSKNLTGKNVFSIPQVYFRCVPKKGNRTL